jgi:hypothetical protein
LFLNDGSDWNWKFQIFALGSVPKVSGSSSTVSGCAVRVKVIVEQSCGVWVGEQRDASATSTISTVWTTERFELFPLYRNTPLASVSRAQVKDYLINK